VNVFGTMQCTRMALACFARNGQPGVIVNVSSVAARTGSPGEYVHYAASKAAIDAFTIGMAREVAARGTRILGVAPGPTSPKIPMGRLAHPEEVAATIVWALSPAASYVTGTVIQCAGGL